jgi:WD40 repeat protein
MSLAFSPDGRTLATINMDNVAHLWRVDEPFSPSSVLQGREDPVSTLDFDTDGYSLVTNFSPDGHTLAHIDEHTVRLWRMEVPNTPPSELTDQEASMSASAFSPDSRFLATGNVSGTVSIWRVDAPSSAPVILRNHEGPITTLAFSPDGRMLASGDRDGTIRLWRLNTPTSPPIVLNAQTYIYALTFSPDGHLLASGSNDPTIRLWHVDAPSSPPIVLPGHEEHIDRLVFSPDGRLLASGGSDKTARLWHVDAPSSPPIVLPGLEGDIDRLAFSPDGRMLATTSSEGAVLIWHVDTPSTLPLIITEQGEVITTLAFSPDGRTLASGDRMGNLRLWHLDGSELVQAACTTAGRNFSLIEWQQLYDTATPYHKTCLWLPHHPNIYQNLLAHGQFDLALMAYQEDYSLASMNAEVTPWLTSQAATENEKDVVQSLLLYLLARWHDPKLRDALPADLGTLCQLGAEKLPTPPFLDACDRALTINPDDLTATYARGRLRTRLGDDAGALSDLQTAQRLAQEQHQDEMLEGIQRWTDDLKAGRDPLAPAPTPAAP